MQPEELKAVFDQQASGYDEQWVRMAPIRDGLHFHLEFIFADVPANARILCVGAGARFAVWLGSLGDWEVSSHANS